MIQPLSVPFVGSSHDDLLGAELIDLITERIANRADARDRAEVLTQVVHCALDALRWRLEPLGDQVEEAGVARVLATAIEHRGAMEARALQSP